MKVVTGIDYLTVSGNLTTIDRLADEMEPIIESLVSDGEEVKTAKRMIYDGRHVGPISHFWSEANDIGFIECAGDYAPVLFDLTDGLDVRVTRIDLAVTCWGDDVGSNVGEKAFLAAGTAAIQRTVTRIEKPDGGFTLYIGSPASNQRGRLYRKDKLKRSQYKHDPTWRYEAMFRKPHAQVIAGGLRSAQTGTARADLIAVTVAAFFRDRGVEVIYPVPPGEALTSSPGKKVTSLDAKLAWLRKGVRPTVETLIEAGLVEDLIHALGLLTPAIIEAVKNASRR